MITLITYYILFFSTKPADWFCSEAASERVGNEIRACGIGSGKDENEARLSAFDNAKAEFDRICSNSSDCSSNKITVTPERTNCSKQNDAFRCERFIVFTMIEGVPNIDGIEPYKQSPSKIKIKAGMSKKDLLATAGAPYSVSTLSYGDEIKTQAFYYDKNVCEENRQICSIILKGDIVKSWRNIKPIYTEDLD